MKKIYLIILVLLINQTVSAGEVVRIYHKDTRYKMLVNYQQCFRDFKKNNGSPCLAPINNVTIEKGQAYVDITLDDYLDYAKPVSAYESDDEKIIAEGHFQEDDETCKSFKPRPLILLSEGNQVICAAA